MKILDWYILKKFLSSFLFVVMIIIAVVMVIDITEKNEYFIRNNLSAMEILGYYGDYIPYVVNFITPITIFIATVFVTARLAGHTEIIAILSGGISFKRLMVPYMIGATLIASASFYLNGWVIPNANKSRIAFELAYLKKPFYFDERNIHMKVDHHSYVYMESYNNISNTGYKFTLETIKDNILQEKLYSRTINWDTAQRQWVLSDWNLRKFDGFKEVVKYGEKKDTVIHMHPNDFTSTHGLHETLTNRELEDFIQMLKDRGADNVAVYEIEKYIRYMSPFTALILTFIGLIVSARKTRGGTGFQIALGFTIAFVFIICFIMARSMAQVGSIPPSMGVWIPNIIFSIVGLIMYKTVPR
jgi:lipopolysaccharide export system permease protein